MRAKAVVVWGSRRRLVKEAIVEAVEEEYMEVILWGT
jgi:hypothetical protein